MTILRYTESFGLFIAEVVQQIFNFVFAAARETFQPIPWPITLGPLVHAAGIFVAALIKVLRTQRGARRCNFVWSRVAVPGRLGTLAAI